jgi:hypothetical protein
MNDLQHMKHSILHSLTIHMVEVVGHNKHCSYFLFLLLVSECGNNHFCATYSATFDSHVS